MGAAVGLGVFALFGWLTGLVFRGFLRGRRLGLGRILLLLCLLQAWAFFALILTVAVFTVGPEEISSVVERGVLKIATWPAFAVVAAWTYWHRTRTRMVSQRIVSPPGVFLLPPRIADVQSTHAADGPPLAPPPPAPLPQPF